MGIEESLGQILAYLEKINNKVDSLSTRLAKIESGAANATSHTSMAASSMKPSDVMDARIKKEEGKVEVDGRLTCPKCGSNRVQEKEDRTKAIDHRGGITIYAKKKYCKDCREEWH